MSEIIYVLTNEAMPGIVKIGKTSNIEQRIKDLDHTAVPLPFVCFYAARVSDGTLVEKKIHFIFGEQRVRKNREFFRADPSRVKAAIELAAIEDMTPGFDDALSDDDVKALDEFSERRAPFRFSLANVPIGATLTFERDENIKCSVINDKNIEFEGKATTLSGAASVLLTRMGWRSPNVQGPLYWLYDGETLNARRLKIEDGESISDLSSKNQLETVISG
jgi:hypothetical protein